MTAARRWSLVAIGVVVLLLLPSGIAALPVRDAEISAAELLDRVRASADVPHSGYAESMGGLLLPVTDQFTSLVDLLGQRTRMRVWWRDAEDWRVDAVTATGETGQYRDGNRNWTWEYEDGRATLGVEPVVRLPREADLLPSALGRRLLNEATAEEVARLPAERIAGREAPGLRLTPGDVRSTIARVDVWVHGESGLPLRVAVFGRGSDTAVLRTSYLDLTLAEPTGADTAFAPPTGAALRFDRVLYAASAADRLAPVRPPPSLAGLDRRPRDTVGAVGEYGRGVTLLVAVPLRGRESEPLREEFEGAPGAITDDLGTAVTVGPLSLLLTPHDHDRQTWLLAGTVTPDTLAEAAADLAVGP
ncbi:hypothetical protein BH20ACT5_BH20ACT5_09030 [soil metagenome]